MLQLFDIRKSYTTADFTQVALDDVSIAFRDNEFVAILGPSGSGKTTLLNIVGGLDCYDSGNLVIDGIETEKYKNRDWDTYRNNRIGFVFQSYNLIPHQTVLSNVELALTLSGVSRAERRQRAKDALIQVGLGDHINKKPSQLSGGQMQRVAVARALINDPEILLADEPTGALDTTTSTQIMDLLTDIAKDRLVIMVTHNPDLADQYATRVVNLLDGRVLNDSDPFVPTKEEAKLSGKAIRRSAMSFFTAISLSFNNLMTKKGRTIMTAFAGSIGIVGIAAILALANGVNNYIKSVEEETLSMYPLSIESTGIDMTAMMASFMGANPGGSGNSNTTGDNDGKVIETKTLSDILTRVEKNDLPSLKAFLESGQSGIEQYTNMISYSYGVRPYIFNPDTSDGVWRVNPNAAFSALSSGGALSGAARGYASMMTSGGNSNIFHEMLNNKPLLETQYDLLAGRWPDKWDECILVLNYEGGIDDYTLYAMGLRDPRELDDIVNQVAKNETITPPEERLEFSYEEIMAVTFKLVNVADMYVYDEQFEVWMNKSDDVEFMKGLIARGSDLRIVGIVALKPDTSVFTLSPGVCYLADLQIHLIEEAAKIKIVKDQLANPEINVLTGRSFAEEREESDRNSLDFSSMFSIDGEAITAAFTFDTSALQIDMSGFSNLNFDAVMTITPPPFDFGALLGQIDISVEQDDVDELIGEILDAFINYYYEYTGGSPTFSPVEIAEAFAAYLAEPETQEFLAEGLTELFSVEKMTEQLQDAFQDYMMRTMQMYIYVMAQTIQDQISWAMTSAMNQLTAGLANAFGVDESAFAKAFNFDFDEKELQELMMSFMTAEEKTFDSNLRTFGYAEFDNPTTIRIYPKDFQSKEYVIQILDDYNRRMQSEGKDDLVIIYNDLVGVLMSSVTDIVNMVSYVLVAFVAISLVVSSIMIGIITYISVLERKKEIGILRSIGASKGDIRNVFNAETLIVGFVAGVIGIIITLILCVPANIIIYNNFGVPNVALLPWQAGALLIAVSMFLSFIAGLIPASSASRKDPVEALRSE
ncbi:MAG: ABC transporter ATP-binding protein/permease [Coriobacteriia bacterium]|nr:ABC transporter ATP-binding protein/permease [Coriobacteriia bacterium]